jgi:enoyl-CoA hydratase/carnithine racemase
VRRIATTIAREISPSSLRVLKRQLYADLLGDLDRSAAFAEEAMVRMVGEADFAEGVAALDERRPPRFPDRA